MKKKWVAFLLGTAAIGYMPSLARAEDLAQSSLAGSSRFSISAVAQSLQQSSQDSKTVNSVDDLEKLQFPSQLPVLSEQPLVSESRISAMDQVTSVTQLSDVQPTDWAFQALQSLVERHGVIASYPDSKFRGNRALTRYEFAAGLNGDLDHFNKLIAAGTTDLVTENDLVTFQKLQEEFAAELATLRNRVDALEARTGILEAQQFSPTAILGGEVIFSLANAWGGGPPGTGESSPVFTNLTRLQLLSSLSGKDRLRMELVAGNFAGLGFANPGVLNTNTALLSYQADTANQIQLSMLEYRFPVFSDRLVLTFRPVGFSLSSVLTANSPYFDSGRGALSRFGEASPLFKIGNLDAGVGFDWLVNDSVRIQYAYGARDASSPSLDRGLFSSNSQAMGLQVLFLPSNNVLAGLTAVYGYSGDGRLNTFTGSAIADASGFISQPANIYGLGGSLQWRITPGVVLGGWGAVIGTYADNTDAGAVSTTFLASLGFPDPFGRRGDLVAFLFGQPPKVLGVEGFGASLGGLIDSTDSYHFEAFYRLTVNNNISISPGFFLVTNPGNIAGNNTIIVGAIRTTFRF